jgi:hypothetical protein
VSRREHVRGRITVPRGDASGLFNQHAQFDWWIDRYGPGPLYAGLRILCAEHRHTAIDVGCVSRDRDCRGGWFGARARAAGFLWRHRSRDAAGAGFDRVGRVTRAARFCLWARHGGLFSFVLAALGAAVAIGGVFAEGPPIEKYKIRGPSLVIIAILSFAAMIRPLGLVPATFLAFMISILGSSEMRWIESLIAAALMTLFCVLLFVYLLNLPFQLWPRFY